MAQRFNNNNKFNRNSSRRMFGFEIEPSETRFEAKSPVEVHDNNGLPVGGASSAGYLQDYRYKGEYDLIRIYRNIALQSEVDYAIDEILNECIIFNPKTSPISIDLTETDLSKTIQQKIRDEFDQILKLLSFKHNSYELFRRWYIDGRLYFNLILDEKHPADGIQEIRFIDPLQIKLVRTVDGERDFRGDVEYTKKDVKEMYLYYPLGIENGAGSAGENGAIEIAKDAIVYVPSGLYDRSRGIVISYLDKVIKPLNNLRALEDSVVIYRLARAPEKRAFYIDVDDMPKAKAEQYMRETMSRYRNKVNYDPKTGLVNDGRNYQAMLEDYWLPRRNGKGTEIDVIGGGDNLGEIEDVEYFKKLVFQALNVPYSRLAEGSESFGWGRDAEISREEIKFSKFSSRLRHSFSKLFDDILRVQLSAKGICTVYEWADISQNVVFDFETEMHYHEQQILTTVQQKLDVLTTIEEYRGKYYSDEYIKRIILGQSQEEVIEMDKQMAKEKKAGVYKDDDEFDDDDDDWGNDDADDGISGNEVDIDGDGDADANYADPNDSEDEDNEEEDTDEKKKLKQSYLTGNFNKDKKIRTLEDINKEETVSEMLTYIKEENKGVGNFLKKIK